MGRVVLANAPAQCWYSTDNKSGGENFPGNPKFWDSGLYYQETLPPCPAAAITSGTWSARVRFYLCYN